MEAHKKFVMIGSLLCASAVMGGPAFAYVGPGLGVGALGGVLGILLAIVLFIAGLIWYPIKRLLKSMKGRTADALPSEEKLTEAENKKL